jgi:acetylornithine deacetylase/succinyl-diaminopimelate desuccinylase-like protein
VATWLASALERASQEFFGRPVGYTAEGGTIPFLASLARRYPDVQFVATGVLGPDSNAHGIDEMLDLPTAVNLINAVTSIVAAFAHRKDPS